MPLSRSLLRLLLAALLPAGATAQEPARPQLARRIDSLWAIEAAPAATPPDTARHSLAPAAAQLRNSALRGILETEGYPGLREVGPASCERFWILLQRADNDPTLQRFALSLLKEQAAARNVPGLHLAWLQDRVLVNAGQRQWYGTQVRLNADSSSFEPRPVEDSVSLDLRRASLGLPPIAEFIALMNRRYREMLKPKE
ncbi:DUF6624 domain-containing protein [Flaviaesturariibacter terrae]